MRNRKNKTKTTFPTTQPFLLPRLKLIFYTLLFWLLSSLPLPLSGVKVYERELQSVGKTLYLLLLPHHTYLTLANMGSFPRNTCVSSTECAPDWVPWGHSSCSCMCSSCTATSFREGIHTCFRVGSSMKYFKTSVWFKESYVKH